MTETEAGWTVELYRDPSGRGPVAEFLATLNETDHAAVTRLVKLLEQYGLKLGKPYVKALIGHRKLWELRVKRPSGAIRLFYFAHTGKRFVILHGFRKKSQKTPKRELRIAEQRMMEMMVRKEE
ncbi:MAG: type II toxin-antitoxin system RelE/ParE family toxin [Chloroflexi bacterium]|nr:type II toxin-antitoxin system RelE/ParE family toxin [Chloroflexota bacterium]